MAQAVSIVSGDYLDWHNQSMMRLVRAVQDLSLARDVRSIMGIVRDVARELTGADGATFVLREGDLCYYADENAIAPLWKGRRFPMSICVSGWVMEHGECAVIEDIYTDPRILEEAYRSTFVKSMTMVPIRSLLPVGAIGCYWAHPHRSSTEEINLLQALADTTAVAMENVQAYQTLEARVLERTETLQRTNRELEAFSYSVSHDLRAPLRSISGFTHTVMTDPSLNKKSKLTLERVVLATERMAELIDTLLKLSRITTQSLSRSTTDLSECAQTLAQGLRGAYTHAVDFVVTPGLSAEVDRDLMRVALQNLLSNAWKFTAKTADARVEFGHDAVDTNTFFIRDNGAGFDMAYADKLFGTFQRMHTENEFPGTGIGLAIVQRIMARHGGSIRAEAAPEKGATFYFTLPAAE